jgi:Fe-coproporphyrin III synthase
MLITDEVESRVGSGTLVLHLLGRCNLTCSHCYMDGGPHRHEQLSLDSVVDAVAAAPNVGVGQIYLTGGEPTLFPRLFEVIEAATTVLPSQVTLCTNATRLSERWVAYLAKTNVAVNVSIDGTAGYHDAFRGAAGAFANSERGIKGLVASGVKVTIVSTISQSNLSMLAALVNQAMAWGVRTFRAQPLLKLGRGEALCDLRLSAAQLDQLILELSDLANRHRGAIRCGLIGQSRRFLQAHPCGAYVCNGTGCHRGVAKEIKKIVVREDGTILPEATNLDRAFAIGRLGEAPLLELVERYLDHGYEAFDRLCRSAYAEVIPSWSLAVVPWDQIIAERSSWWRPDSPEVPTAHCATCGSRPNSLPVH